MVAKWQAGMGGAVFCAKLRHADWDVPYATEAAQAWLRPFYGPEEFRWSEDYYWLRALQILLSGTL